MNSSELQAWVNERLDKSVDQLFTRVNCIDKSIAEFSVEVRKDIKLLMARFPHEPRCEEHERLIMEQGKRLRRLSKGWAAIAAVFTTIGIVLGWAMPVIAEHFGTLLSKGR